MNHILLLGAGFSRNWGGWLAQEAFEYLLGCPQIDDGLRKLLWDYHERGGFEAALARLQESRFHSDGSKPNPQLSKLQEAILQMFNDMDKAFTGIQFEINNQIGYGVSSFLTRFDAIFTLNQDLLIERHYLDGSAYLHSNGKWDGTGIPGVKPSSQSGYGDTRYIGKLTPNEDDFKMGKRTQPYFKLHGSSNWYDLNSQELLVLGGNKASIINQYPILKWSHEQFKERLSLPDTRLMVIGYSFGDDHINKAIGEAVKGGNLRMFVIDPLGVDAFDRLRTGLITAPSEFAIQLRPIVIGASRRTLQEIFGDDRVEHGKVLRFFE
ncbi:MAG: SIR2 family protein [Nitrospinae bacterium]|nr:SIR2 family protein [Nitrospinota bacterium]